MMYRKTQQRVYMNRGDLKLQRRVLALVCVVLLAAVISLIIVIVNHNNLESKASQEIHDRMYSAYNSTYDAAKRFNSATSISDMVTYSTMIQQYVYYMKQLNDLNRSLYGSLLVSTDMLAALDSDLSILTSHIKQSTSLTSAECKNLIDHLDELNAMLQPVLRIDAPR